MHQGQQDPSSSGELQSEDVTGPVRQKVWEPTFFYKADQEIHYYAGYEIKVQESFDSHGAIIWPASLALCRYLDVNRETLDLTDKAVLEIGAGTGLVSIVASLLGSWVTATDLPDVLGNLRSNLCRNTRGRCRYTPQAAALLWGYNLEQTFPRSVYRYDYVLAADVVYHHDFLAELLATMRHFCQPGTTLIWANKIRFRSDLAFIENMKQDFNIKLLDDTDGINIYSATAKELQEERKFPTMEENTNEQEMKNCLEEVTLQDILQIQHQHPEEVELTVYDEKYKIQELNGDPSVKQAESDMTNDLEQSMTIKQTNKNTGGDDFTEIEEKNFQNDPDPHSQSPAVDPGCPEPNGHVEARQSRVCYIPGKEIHYFMGHKITIDESLDSYGAVIWPAAVALYDFLETPAGQEQINLLDKTVLEIGAGTGLLSVVATLLGAKLTATDLPEILSNLRFNLNRNTRMLRRHEPQVMELSWGHKLEETFPHGTYHYDYVLSADVVYHHDFLHELLVTMHHFCQPGTTLIWANKIRYRSDLVFLKNFEETFHTSLLAELNEIRIYSATYRREKLDLHKNGKEWRVNKN
ncbi:uncharacterized protein LOC134329221 [Trichomycterus rosablanca]|uniref:uncharacterized protein LOC134329221 n=1 Tax=Trichomycterus rosablanca TaxID=2290929 RepID=UPI002F35A2F5